MLLPRALEDRNRGNRGRPVLGDGRCLPPGGDLWNRRPYNRFQDAFQQPCQHSFINLHWRPRRGCELAQPPHPEGNLARPNTTTCALPFDPAIPRLGIYAQLTLRQHKHASVSQVIHCTTVFANCWKPLICPHGVAGQATLGFRMPTQWGTLRVEKKNEEGLCEPP